MSEGTASPEVKSSLARLPGGISLMELLKGSGWHDVVDKMQVRTAREVELYLADRLQAYASERRFGSDAYWTMQKRHATQRGCINL